MKYKLSRTKIKENHYKTFLFIIFSFTGPATLGASDTFLCSKKKKVKQRKARKTFKVKTIKSLSLRPKLYCLSHSRASRIQKCFLSANHGGRQYFSVFHGPSTLKSISAALFYICLFVAANLL